MVACETEGQKKSSLELPEVPQMPFSMLIDEMGSISIVFPSGGVYNLSSVDAEAILDYDTYINKYKKDIALFFK